MQKQFCPLNQKQCIPVMLLDQQPSQQNLLCTICFQLMINPVRLTCNHIFGLDCLQKWWKGNHKICPLCKIQVQYQQIKNPKISEIKIKCTKCQWRGKVQRYFNHYIDCQNVFEAWVQEKQKAIKSMRSMIDKEITPHLIEDHYEIYEKRTTKWQFLHNEDKSWIWWWWCSQPWWNNKPCPKCNVLWKDKRDEIDIIDEKRRIALRSLVHLNPLKLQQFFLQ